jgi:hypothetical protein
MTHASAKVGTRAMISKNTRRANNSSGEAASPAAS